ncbi:MAG: hypothetical protein AMXMBFR34_27490 [Myxococcaceae bacterium]
MTPAVDLRVKWFHARRFCLKETDGPEQPRASGDSGFVAHLTASTHGATGWDWSFRLVKPGHGWAFASDGRLSLFLDEPGQYVPDDAKVGDLVAVRLPRARENLHPHRFTLFGGQGGPTVGHGFKKYFLPIAWEGAAGLVETFAGRAGDGLRFGLYLANASTDYGRADAAVLDVGGSDEASVLKVVESFANANPAALSRRGLPYGTQSGPLGLPVAEAFSKADLCDGYGWRRSREAVQAGVAG